MSQTTARGIRCTRTRKSDENYKNNINKTLDEFRDRIEDNQYNRKYILNRRGINELLNMKKPEALKFNLKCYPADQSELESNQGEYKQKYLTFWQNMHNQVKIAEFLNRKIEKIVQQKMKETKNFNLRGLNLSKLRMLSAGRKKHEAYINLRCLSMSPKRRPEEGLTMREQPRKIANQIQVLSPR